MTDEQNELRQINWTEVFSFTHIFKSFKMAIHPSKLVLALAAVVTVFCAGWVMDGFWSLADSKVYPNEISDYFTKAPDQFDKDKESWQDSRQDRAAALLIQAEQQKYSLNTFRFKLPSGYLQTGFGQAVTEANQGIQAPTRSLDDLKNKDLGELLDDAEELFDDEIDRSQDLLDKAEDKAEEEIKKIDDKAQRKKANKLFGEHCKLADQKITERRVEFARAIKAVRGETIFVSLMDYQQQCLGNAILAVRYGNIFGGLREYRQKRTAKAIPAQAVELPQAPAVPAPVPANERAGFLYWVLLAVHGIGWLVCQHWVYALLFLVICLAVIAVFGGAIHRIAALHFAREEKISIGQALKFSLSKFLSFFTAPLIPLVFIILLGLLLAVGGLIGSIPYFGTILMGLLFILAIGVGLLIAFLSIGLVAGFPLMYPTIAVEGSDSFDAISRSFSYVFSRPWRAGLYGLVSLVYGVITYLFVRFFAFLALAATHCFVSLGVCGYGDRLHADADKLDVMWQAPTFDRLFGPFNWEAMGGAMPLGAWLIGLWVFLVAATVFAYLLSYAASSTTTIYYLLRKKVDATDLDDVYVEEEEEPLETPAEEGLEETEEKPSEEQEGPADKE